MFADSRSTSSAGPTSPDSPSTTISAGPLSSTVTIAFAIERASITAFGPGSPTAGWAITSAAATSACASGRKPTSCTFASSCSSAISCAQLVLERAARPPPRLLLLADQEELRRREPRHHLGERPHEQVLALPLRELRDADDERDAVPDPELATGCGAVDGGRVPARSLDAVHHRDDTVGRDAAPLDDQAPRPVRHRCDQVGAPQSGPRHGRHPVAVLGVEPAHPLGAARPGEQEAVHLVAGGVVSVHDIDLVTTQVPDRAHELADRGDELEGRPPPRTALPAEPHRETLDPRRDALRDRPGVRRIRLDVRTPVVQRVNLDLRRKSPHQQRPSRSRPEPSAAATARTRPARCWSPSLGRATGDAALEPAPRPSPERGRARVCPGATKNCGLPSIGLVIDRAGRKLYHPAQTCARARFGSVRESSVHACPCGDGMSLAVTRASLAT